MHVLRMGPQTRVLLSDLLRSVGKKSSIPSASKDDNEIERIPVPRRR